MCGSEYESGKSSTTSLKELRQSPRSSAIPSLNKCIRTVEKMDERRRRNPMTQNFFGKQGEVSYMKALQIGDAREPKGGRGSVSLRDNKSTNHMPLQSIGVV